MTTTLVPAQTSATITLSGGNLTATRTSGTNYYGSSLSNSSAAATAMYVEIPSVILGDAAFGVSNAPSIPDSDGAGSGATWLGSDTNSIGAFFGGREVYSNAALVGGFVAPVVAGDCVAVWVERGLKQVWFNNIRTGEWIPSISTGFDITSLGTGPLYFGFSLSAGLSCTVNFDGTFLGDATGASRWDGTPLSPVFTTMPAAQGTLALTRNDAVLKRTYAMPAVKGTLALTGIANAMKRAVPLVAATRAFVLSGIAAGLNKAGAQSMTAASGQITLTGIDANLARTTAYQMAADAGALVLSGVDAALQSARKLIVDVGALLLTGWPAGLVWQPAAGGGTTLTAAPGAFALTGYAAALRVAVPVIDQPVTAGSLLTRTYIHTLFPPRRR